MNHTDHVNLLRDGIATPGGTWADFGSGGGAFTLALADLLGSEGVIYSVDRNESVLKEQARAMQASFPDVEMHYLTADFTQPLTLPPLDGIVAANSLHFHKHKDPILQLVKGYLKPGGRLLIVEYNTDKSNPWVPYPFSFSQWKALADKNGFAETRLLFVRTGRSSEFYSALSVK